MAATSATGKLVTVFGGSGFVGRHVVRALARQGWRVRVGVRRPDLAHHLQPLGTVGQVHAVQANLRYPASIASAVAGADAVVNLVGILAPSGQQTFQSVHVAGAQAIAAASRAAGVASLAQMSALGASLQSHSGYARSKAEGEAAAMAAMPNAIVLRPSVIFGPEDTFLNRFAAMARMSPALPLIGGGATRFQPVFVGDVAEAVARGVSGEAKGGVYELGGPEIRSFRQIMTDMLAIIGRKRLLVSIPFPAARILASVVEMLPGAPLTADQVAMLEVDNVVSAEAEAAGRTLKGLGIEPRAMLAIAPTYLWRFRKSGQFDASRFA